MAEMTRKNPLLPDRHSPDLFVCDIVDATPKGDMGSMEHPVFTLSTKPDTQIREYKNGDTFVKVTPSTIGLATVHDRDILIYCISQCMAKLNNGEKVHKRMRFKAYDMLHATNRQTSGQGYQLLRQALTRLRGTTVETNIKQGGNEHLKIFGLIESAEIVRETRDGRMQDIEITLSDWIFDAIENENVLTLDRDYFRLRKPLERRLYEVFRKHCGRQKEFKISLEKLQVKAGSTTQKKDFKRKLKAIIADNTEHQHIPEYDFEMDDLEIITVKPRKDVKTSLEIEATAGLPPLKTQTLEDAKVIASNKGYDVYALEQEWRDWVITKQIKVYEPNMNFIKFVEQKEPLR